MTDSNFSIIKADKTDAPLIAKAIAVALHMDDPDGGTVGFDNEEEKKVWNEIFTRLAAREDSQYSYRNTVKAITDKGETAGFLISYDGALLHELREAFFEEVKRATGNDMHGIADETEAGEWYLDSLAVWPQFRGRGIGKALLLEGIRKAREAGKPAALLVDKDNIDAEALYSRFGFKYKGEKPFAGTMMKHMQTDL